MKACFSETETIPSFMRVEIMPNFLILKKRELEFSKVLKSYTCELTMGYLIEYMMTWWINRYKVESSGKLEEMRDKRDINPECCKMKDYTQFKGCYLAGAGQVNQTKHYCKGCYLSSWNLFLSAQYPVLPLSRDNSICLEHPNGWLRSNGRCIKSA